MPIITPKMFVEGDLADALELDRIDDSKALRGMSQSKRVGRHTITLVAKPL